jgi:hypothetical protein
MICSCYIIIFILLVIFIMWNQNQSIRENWMPYISGPYGTIRTGSSPLRTYTRMLYREPYMYPYQFITTYPLLQNTFFVPN